MYVLLFILFYFLNKFGFSDYLLVCTDRTNIHSPVLLTGLLLQVMVLLFPPARPRWPVTPSWTSGLRGSAPGARDCARSVAVPEIPVQQPEQRDSSPALGKAEHVATTEPMRCTAVRPTDRGAWQQRKTS